MAVEASGAATAKHGQKNDARTLGANCGPTAACLENRSLPNALSWPLIRFRQEAPKIKAGIIDTAKVGRTAIEDAGSIAAQLITPEAMITDAPKGAPANGDRGGMSY